MEMIIIKFQNGDTKYFMDVISDSIKLDETGNFILFKTMDDKMFSVNIKNVNFIEESPIQEEENEDIH